jgi:hypothetical protein
MAVTSLIKPVQNKKGIFYNFQSALEDINITLSNSENAVRFSKFILLRIPEIGEPNALQTDNKIQFYAQGETPLIEGLNTDNNVNLAQSFQNYALNLEALLLSRSQYKKDEKLTISERVFWKWLKELGAIRFQDANTLEKNFAVLGTGAGSERFVEKPETNSTYKRVVKYIGDIDVVNSLKNNTNSYTEVYIHVPSNVGTTPHVLFKSVKDANYYPNLTIANIDADPLDIEYLAGRKYNEIHPFGLSLKAFYDLDDAGALAQIKNSFTAVYSAGNWFNKTIKNAYYTDTYLDPTTGNPSPDPVSGDSYRYNVAADQYIYKQLGLKSVEYVRSTLDGISIDFDLANYKLASENAEIKVFAQFNDYVANRDFEFNAILIYYDTYDPNNLDSNGLPVDFRTNLYGVLFLDRIQQSGLEFQIPTILKFKQDPLNKVNGNAFSFKMNLKLDSSIEDALVERSINDYSTFSLELFTDVLTEFKQLQQRYNDKLLELDQLRQDVENLKGLLLNTEDQTELATRVTNLETSVTANSAIFENTAALVNLITSVNDKVDSIVNGTTNATVSYNIDGVRPGEGISIDRRTPGRIRVVNTNQQYNISNSSLTNIFNSPIITLSAFTNYIVHQNSGAPIVLDRDLQVFITDYPVSWKKGQTLRLVFDDELVLGTYNLKFYTDYLNRKSLGQYGVQIGLLISDDFTVSNNKPIFDIVCIDDVALSFRIDKIR